MNMYGLFVYCRFCFELFNSMCNVCLMCCSMFCDKLRFSINSGLIIELNIL